jgi:hypothetical protein
VAGNRATAARTLGAVQKRANLRDGRGARDVYSDDTGVNALNACAQAARLAASPSRTAIAAATAIMTRAVGLLIRLTRNLPPKILRALLRALPLGTGFRRWASNAPETGSVPVGCTMEV